MNGRTLMTLSSHITSTFAYPYFSQNTRQTVNIEKRKEGR